MSNKNKNCNSSWEKVWTHCGTSFLLSQVNIKMILRTLKLRTNYLESDSIALWCLKLVYPWSLLLVFFSSIKMQIFTSKKKYWYSLEKYSKDDPICNQRYQKHVNVHYGKIYDGKSNSCVISVKLYRRWKIVRFLWINAHIDHYSKIKIWRQNMFWKFVKVIFITFIYSGT